MSIKHRHAAARRKSVAKARAAKAAGVARAGVPPAIAVTAARKGTGLSALLLNKHQVVALAGFTYPSIWKMMRVGAFPHGRVCGGKTVWLASEIEAWIASLPVRRLKGDAPPPGQTAIIDA
jgi:predicted DNA-binding transcriptional regulator AlpA